MTRPEIAALFDAFAMLPPGNASLTLHGSEYEAPFRAWAAQHGHAVDETAHHPQTAKAYTRLQVRLAGGWVTVFFDIMEQPEAAEGSA